MSLSPLALRRRVCFWGKKSSCRRQGWAAVARFCADSCSVLRRLRLREAKCRDLLRVQDFCRCLDGFGSEGRGRRTRLYARVLPISITTLMSDFPSDSNRESRSLTSSRTAQRSSPESVRYDSGIDPILVSIGSNIPQTPGGSLAIVVLNANVAEPRARKQTFKSCNGTQRDHRPVKRS
jgi:hypothetical protein